MANIVLAHGFLGYGQLPLLPVNYFNGIKALFESKGHTVVAPSVSPLGALALRSEQLATQIEQAFPGNSDIYVIGHSMGGLDTRRVIAQYPVGKRIKKLITVATPHLGSPVADAVLSSIHPLNRAIPTWLRAALRNDAGALKDLCTRPTPQDVDCPWVTYMEVVCTIPATEKASAVFQLAQAIGELDGPNDGVVTLTSARYPGREPVRYWELDHGEAIGWPSTQLGWGTSVAAFFPPKGHEARYLDLLTLL